MKKLNSKEIKQVANVLCMTGQQAQEVADTFVKIFTEEQKNKIGWKIGLQLESADDYIREWENHWHREMSWKEYYSYEKENCYYDYDEAEEIFKTIETFKEYVKMYNFAYELSDGMIIIVC